MKNLNLKTLMTKDVTYLPPEVSLHQVVQTMAKEHYSCMVIKKDQFPVGIVTERDLVKVLSQEEGEVDLSLPVAGFMSSPVLCLNEDEMLFDAMVISRTEKIRHIPVINNDEHMVGLVTYSDLVNAYFKITETQSEMIEQAVVARTGELQQLNDELQTLSMEDHLMAIGNRRAMEVDLTHTHNASIRYGNHYSVLLLDLDYFKYYNDHYGHQAGDDALKSVAKSLKESIRGSDRIYRYGGEEILLVLPNTNATQADEVAQKLVSLIANSGITHEKSPHKFLTVSCGGACAIKNGSCTSNWEALIEQVDHNLYQAKDSGRNRSVISK